MKMFHLSMDQTRHPTVLPRQNRAMRTRAALIVAVETIVADEGPEAVTTTRVATETGLAVGSVYRYFPDRDALLLAAYDETVRRIVASCEAALAALPGTLSRQDAATRLLSEYLSAADAIPAHSGLLRAMRSIRPVEVDQAAGQNPDIVRNLLAPFIERYGERTPDHTRLAFLSVLLGTMVDLYLVTTDASERNKLRRELDAHMLLALARLGD